MKQYADIVVFDKYGQLVLIAEVKSKPGTSSDWAKKMRRNMYAHGLLPDAPFFLLALPDRFYLWKNAHKTLEPLEPTEQIDPTAFLQPYYKRSGISPNDISGDSFELVVVAWLNQVLSVDNPQDLLQENQDWLVSSGLFDCMRGGHLVLAAAA
ncbi:MAG TPA: hypothetical protein V6D48_24295 [Oculatellaceae cyanobacterium]